MFIFIYHEYVVMVTTFFQCMLLIELNAWEDECLVAIDCIYIYIYIYKSNKATKKMKKKKMF
jgi:hypothetical protein